MRSRNLLNIQLFALSPDEPDRAALGQKVSPVFSEAFMSALSLWQVLGQT